MFKKSYATADGHLFVLFYFIVKGGPAITSLGTTSLNHALLMCANDQP